MSYNEQQLKEAVNKVFDNKETMIKEVTAIAELIATKSPLSIRGTKRNIVFARDHSVNESLEFIANWNAAQFYSNDLLAAFTQPPCSVATLCTMAKPRPA